MCGVYKVSTKNHLIGWVKVGISKIFKSGKFCPGVLDRATLNHHNSLVRHQNQVLFVAFETRHP